MVDFVLKNAGGPAIEAQFNWFAVPVQSAHADRFVPVYFAQIAGDGEAAFDAIYYGAGAPDDFRVGDDV